MVSKGTSPDSVSLSRLVLPTDRPEHLLVFESQMVDFFVDAPARLPCPAQGTRAKKRGAERVWAGSVIMRG